MLDINLATFQREAERNLTDEVAVQKAVERFKRCSKAADRLDEFRRLRGDSLLARPQTKLGKIANFA
jgi:hypothetical protein